MDLTFNARQIALRLAVAAAIGMLIGFERESQHKGVGIRTFSLTSLLGTICALLGRSFALEGMGVITVLTLAVTLKPNAGKAPGRQLGLTTAVALVSTALLGMLVGFGNASIPIAAAIIITMLLSLSEQFQRITTGVTTTELRSGVLLGLIGFVIYPALPNHFIDPYSLINPREEWITVIAVAAIGFLNYVLLRLYARRGLYYAAVLGGLVNSTATIAELATWITGEGFNPLSMGVTLSLLTVIAMFFRNFIILAIFSPSSGKLAAAPLFLMGLAAAVEIWRLRTREDPAPEELALDSPVSLGKILRFGAMFVAIQVAGTLAQRYFGGAGFIVVSLIGGTVSSASTAAAAAHLSAHGELSPGLAATGAVLSSITSALTNIPVLQRQTRRYDLAARLTWITLGLAAIGILTVVAEFKLHLHV